MDRIHRPDSRPWILAGTVKIKDLIHTWAQNNVMNEFLLNEDNIRDVIKADLQIDDRTVDLLEKECLPSNLDCEEEDEEQNFSPIPERTETQVDRDTDGFEPTPEPSRTTSSTPRGDQSQVLGAINAIKGPADQVLALVQAAQAELGRGDPLPMLGLGTRAAVAVLARRLPVRLGRSRYRRPFRQPAHQAHAVRRPQAARVRGQRPFHPVRKSTPP